MGSVPVTPYDVVIDGWMEEAHGEGLGARSRYTKQATITIIYSVMISYLIYMVLNERDQGEASVGVSSAGLDTGAAVGAKRGPMNLDGGLPSKRLYDFNVEERSVDYLAC